MSIEVSQNKSDLLTEQYKRRVVKSEPFSEENESLNAVYFSQSDLSSVDSVEPANQAKTEESAAILTHSSRYLNETQSPEGNKAESSYKDLDEELFSLADLAWQFQSSLLAQYSHSEKVNESLNQQTELSKPSENQKVTKSCSNRGSRVHKCDHCHKSFFSALHLIGHKRIHTCEKPYSCNQCDKSFISALRLFRHKRTHAGVKPYGCDQCDQSFFIASRLIRHKRTHTGEKPYTCDMCSKSFVTSSSLTIHNRTHTGEKLYSCDQCNKSFISAKSLNYHKRTHTGEKPCSCEQCDKAFFITSHLIRHKRTHTGEKPYSCDLCSNPHEI